MGVAYNGNSIIPAPFVHITKEFTKTEDGTSIGSMFVITLKGKLSADRGSPNSGQAFYSGGGMLDDSQIGLEGGITQYNHLSNLLRKQEALRQLFALEGMVLEIDPVYPDSAAPAQCNPRIRSIEFSDGLWFNTCDYTIVFEADVMRGAGLHGSFASGEDNWIEPIQKAQEDWSIEAADDIGRTYRLTHVVSATGKRMYEADGTLFQGSGAWQHAQLWVQARIGMYDKSHVNPQYMVSPSGGAIGPGSFLNVKDGNTPSAFNFLRAEHTNMMAGSYSVTETWLVFDATNLPYPAIEDYTVNVRTDDTGRTHATIEGTIRGLEVRDNISHSYGGGFDTYITNFQNMRYINASGYWGIASPGIFTKANSYVAALVSSESKQLNPQALNYTIGQNPITGVITYSFEYNDRPPSLVPGSISEHYSLGYDNPTDVVAQVTVLGRPLGPVIQQIGTVTTAHKTLNIEIQMSGANMVNRLPIAPNTNSIVASFAPSGALVYWLEKDTPNYDITNGRYTRTTTWGFEGNG